MAMFVGKDPFYAAFNGEIKTTNVYFGEGAFVINDFTKVKNAKPYEAPPKVASKPEKFHREKPKTEASSFESKGSLKQVTVDDDDLSSISEYGFYLWSKFSF